MRTSNIADCGDLDCMLDEQEAQIYVFESFQQFPLPYDAGEVLSEFLCVFCEHGVPTPTEESHNNVQY